ncbi:helix-hairpin-helix domain-containing protein [Sporosarcina aquimarina]|uniref:Helix-hairpin-helix domain-containing protein n=1 Tax=Sporosarcina aquimarina TaxID=114975 RepID=A0ABU4FWB1_9BACL|nr:helix-hairpin-helix domain-containing protein [Sporosarcina aquimarina]
MYQSLKLESEIEDELPNSVEVAVPSPQIIVVDVKGAVLHPNVYTLTEGQRVIDAISAAGGYTQNADSKLLNHAQRLADETVIYVPIIGEEVPVFEMPEVGTGTPNKEVSLLVNINIADEQQLMTLTGIGPAKASAIVKYRTEQGVFQQIEDLMKVTGIGQKTFETLSDSISVN